MKVLGGMPFTNGGAMQCNSEKNLLTTKEVDNRGEMYKGLLYPNNNRSSTKLKHIDIKFLVVKERVHSGYIFVEHLGTNSMITYSLTKGLPPKVFHEHVAHMNVLQFEESLV